MEPIRILSTFAQNLSLIVMVRFIDLFAGIGGIRKGFEQAFHELEIETECVLTSEIKEHAISVLNANHPNENVLGDITQISNEQIPDFDFLLAGFPCQAFSNAGKRLGFMDTRGTMFFEIARILKEKQPYGFILENVEGLVNHDKQDKKAKTGRTLETILSILQNDLKYNVTWKVLNSKEFGVAQERKRIYIVGTTNRKVPLDNFPLSTAKLSEIMEEGLETANTPFTRLLLSHFQPTELYGKSIKDKRGGDSNIHSWDIELKGSVTEEQKKLLNMLFRERRKKKWAVEIGIKWMDGMPLTEKQISTFYTNDNLSDMLRDLTKKGYLKYEHPKKAVKEKTEQGIKSYRVPDTTLPKGYNIVAGKLSFEINKILDPNGITPTLVAMDMKKLFVIDNGGLRNLSLREGLRLCGYPDDFSFPVEKEQGYDLLGNTVVVPVIKAVARRLGENYIANTNHENE